MHAPCAYQTRHAAGDALATHRHRTAYAALVLDGDYLEASADGPAECVPGSLILHPRFHAHGDRFGRRGARVINLDLPPGLAPETVTVLRVPALAEAAAVFARGAHELPALVAACAAQPPAPLHDWQRPFLDALRDGDAPIARLARDAGVSLAHASRSFLRSHGMPPQLLRRELRCRRALALLAGDAPLAEVAARSGFADQSHLTRALRGFAGLPPARLRRQIKSVQDGAAAGMRP